MSYVLVPFGISHTLVRINIMSEIYTIQVTFEELEAIKNITETVKSMLGCSTPDDASDFDTEMRQELSVIDSLFERNGIEFE